MQDDFWVGVVAFVKLVVKSVLRYVDALGEVEADVMFLEFVKGLVSTVVRWYRKTSGFSLMERKLNPKVKVS